MTITPDSLMTLEAYARFRKTEKPAIVAHAACAWASI